jgi:hypothetical protein
VVDRHWGQWRLPKLIEPDCDAEIAYSDITARGMVQRPVFKTLLTGMQE